MTSALELHALSYWRACRAIHNADLSPVDRMSVLSQIRALASTPTGRVKALAAKLAWPPQPDRAPSDDGRRA